MPQTNISSPTPFERTTRRVGLFLLAPILILATIPVAVHISLKPDLGFAVHRLTIRSLDPAGPGRDAGLRTGDRILTVNGRPIEDMPHWYAATAGDYQRREMRLQVRRDGTEQIVFLRPAPPDRMTMIRDYSLWVAGLAFLVIGWWVFWRRADLVARNFFALSILFAFFLLDVPDLPSVPYMQIKENLRALLQLLLPAYFLRFFLHFPSPRRLPGGASRRWRGILLPAWILFGLAMVLEHGVPEPFARDGLPLLEGAALLYSLACFVIGLGVFTRRILRRDRPIERTRMMVVLLGLVLGLLPFMAALMIANWGPPSMSANWQYLACSLLLVPASFGLSIMRYGALDRSFVVRVSLIYGVLTLVVLLVYFLLVVGLGHILTSLFHIDTYPLLLLVLATASLTILPLRRLIQGWIDETFYPGRRIARQATAALGRRLTSLIDMEEVSHQLLSGLDSLFHPRVLHLAASTHSEGHDFRIQTHGEDPQLEAETPRLERDSGLAILLDRLRRPVFTEELEDLLFTGDSDLASLELLTRLRTDLLVPLISGNRLLGFLAFGPKKAGQLYTQEDFSQLQDLAVQAGSILESRQLYRESLQRKVMQTELDLARSIQTGLLPAEALEDETAIIAGRQESCRMVGGDYFDYFRRKDGCLGFALADVAGKGIPAALHMTSLRVAFRQEAELEDIPHLVVQRLNRTVAHLVAPGQFICLFYGVWDPTRGVLTYCNAGCEPPILLAARRNYPQYLRKGGPVLGVTEEIVYRQGALVLEPGDRLFLYTDGLTDQVSPDEEFFDKERLLALLAEYSAQTPPQLLESIFSRINAFGGVERSDDKTAIALEIKTLK